MQYKNNTQVFRGRRTKQNRFQIVALGIHSFMTIMRSSLVPGPWGQELAKVKKGIIQEEIGVT